MKTFKKDELNVRVFETRESMGEAAATEVSHTIAKVLKEKEYVNIIFASAPSQNEFLATLKEKDVEWNRVNAFHMDEYVGLAPDAPQGFGTFLKERLFKFFDFRSINYINGSHVDAEQECERYADLLKRFPTDIVILGIGENTHLAFNDPHVAFFDDPKIVKVVDMDETTRKQQVNDGSFPTLDNVPVFAITITIPTLFNATYAYAICPGSQKASAIEHTLNSEIGEAYPSTILRRHENAVLFIDVKSASRVKLPSSLSN
ncbi:MAG TPA: 6-phosphogluconolactonase [Flavitalea sp.]|nr:6-phosphogluconolactonase [Flavitalea sp.]